MKGLSKALGDIRAGAVMPGPPPGVVRGAALTTAPGDTFDYSHTLPSSLAGKGYQLQVHVPTGGVRNPTWGHDVGAFVSHNGQNIGHVVGRVSNGALTLDSAKTHEAHQGQGLGTAAYESVMAHAVNHLDVTKMQGGEHSSSAHLTQMKVTGKHGLGYDVAPISPGHDPRTQGKPRDQAYPAYEYPMTKSEEVSRLLQHPNPAERAMALKMDGVSPEHLEQGAKDTDPGVHLYAINHPDFNHELGIRVMQSAAGMPAKVAVLHRQDLARPEHLAALYENRHIHDLKDVYSKLVNHPVLDEDLARVLHNDPHLAVEHRHALLEHPYTPEDVHHEVLDTALKNPGSNLDLVKQSLVHANTSMGQIEKLLLMAIGSNRHDVHDMARHVLQERIIPAKVIRQILTSARLHTDQAHAELRVAAVSGPGADEGHLDELMKDHNPLVHQAAAQIPTLKSRHIDTILDRILTTHSRDDKALSALMDHPAWGYQHFHRLLGPLKKAESLEKAINPVVLAGVANATDPLGRAHTDHVPDLTSHSPRVDVGAKAYKEQVLESRDDVPSITQKAAGAMGGISQKAFFKGKVKGQPATFMVKPGYERVDQHWGRNSVLRPEVPAYWSELRHRDIYRLAGLEDNHQLVHLVEHDMGRGLRNEPALVVQMETGFKHADEVRPEEMDDESIQRMKETVRQVAVLDCLVNGFDRHEWNLMVGPDGRVVAIDHGRTFHYAKPRKPNRAPTPRSSNDPWNAKVPMITSNTPLNHDDFASYMNKGAVGKLDPDLTGVSKDEEETDRRERYKPTFQWWKKVGARVREGFLKDLERTMTNPEVREHIKRNFEARADWFDDLALHGIENAADDWHREEIPYYKFGEVTEKEKKDKKFMAVHRARKEQRENDEQEQLFEREKAKSKFFAGSLGPPKTW